jgi:hypothetical protein
MTEAEWATSNDPGRMLRPCRRIIRQHPRKGLLFGVACCERIRHLLIDPRSQAAVEMAARYADGLAGAEQLKRAERAAGAAHVDAFKARGNPGASAEGAAWFVASLDAWFAASQASSFAYAAAEYGLETGREHTAQAHLLRCVFGPLPFRSVAIDPFWLAFCEGSVVQLAQGVYEDRAFDRMPILADALEEAGCTDAGILAHCRQSGKHTRGCWVLDLLLGKE